MLMENNEKCIRSEKKKMSESPNVWDFDINPSSYFLMKIDKIGTTL